MKGLLKGMLLMIIIFLACKNCVGGYTQKNHSGLFYLLMFIEIFSASLIAVCW